MFGLGEDHAPRYRPHTMPRALRLSEPRLARKCAPAWVWLLLVAALAMRAVFPAGIMAEARGSTIVVGICNSDAKMRIEIPARHDGDEGKAKPSPCAFASLAHVAIGASPSIALPRPTVAKAAYRAQRVRPFATAPPRLRPPVRGPPLPA